MESELEGTRGGVMEGAGKQRGGRGKGEEVDDRDLRDIKKMTWKVVCQYIAKLTFLKPDLLFEARV